MNALNDLFALLPELVAGGTGAGGDHRRPVPAARGQVAADPDHRHSASLLAGIGCVQVWGINEHVFGGFYVVDDLSVFFKVRHAGDRDAGGAVRARPTWSARRLPLGEFNVILLFSLTGMFVLASS